MYASNELAILDDYRLLTILLINLAQSLTEAELRQKVLDQVYIYTGPRDAYQAQQLLGIMGNDSVNF